MVTSSYPKFPGDVTAPFIESIARSVAERGHRVDVVLPHHPDLKRPADEPVRFFPYRYVPLRAFHLWGYAQSLESDVRVRKGVYLLAPLVARALRRTVKARLLAERYAVVHAHWLVPNAAMITDVVRGGTRRVPLVISLHGSDVSLAERLWPARVLARRALVAAGAITACSGDLHARALRLGASPDRVRTVPYGVDLPAASEDRAAVRARLSVPEGALLVLALGRLVEKKGFAYLVDAAARVPGVFVAIAGEGDLAQELEARIRTSAAPARCVGPLDRAQVASALRAAEVLVVPSIVDRSGNVDGLPNALLEGMAAGCAIVASRVAGIPEVVEDGVTGLLVPEKDAGALAGALVRLAADPSLRARLGAAAKEKARRELTWPEVAHRLEESYAAAAALDAG